jgi:hypothetical protein
VKNPSKLLPPERIKIITVLSKVHSAWSDESLPPESSVRDDRSDSELDADDRLSTSMSLVDFKPATAPPAVGDADPLLPSVEL